MSRTWAYTLRDGVVHGEIFDDAASVPVGWVDSPARVGVVEPVAPVAPVAAHTGKAALIAEAEALGVDVDKRWGSARLRAAIAEARA